MEWPNDPWLLGTVLLSALWYALGARRPSLKAVPAPRRWRRRTWQELGRHVAFYAALATILVSLGSLDRLSDELFWVHMLQHTLLMLVAAPLLVYAAPWNAFWRPLALGFRRTVAKTVVRAPALAPLRRAAGWIMLPIPAWILFNADLAAWHVPAAYDLTLRNPAVHYAEHLSFIALGIVFWAQTMESPPFRTRLNHLGRAVFASAGAVSTWILAIVLTLAQKPLYPAYAALPHRPGGISALTDQQIAAGVMIGPGSIPFALVVVWALYLWLEDEDSPGRRRRARTRAPIGESPA